MLLLFFLVWVIFNGNITVEIVLFGLAISACMFWFVCAFMGHSLRRELTIYKKIPLFLKYVYVLVREIVKANISVCRLIFSRRERPDPVLVRVHTELKSEFAKMLLANSITLTPGTITVSLTGQELLVHCLDRSMADGMEDSEFVRLLEELEKEAR